MKQYDESNPYRDNTKPWIVPKIYKPIISNISKKKLLENQFEYFVDMI